MDQIVTRFAPSPTGHLHIGGARTALFCWAFARANGGRFMLRIEDTDQARSSDESTRGILEDLAWLGVEWDDGPELRVGDRTIGGDSRRVGPYHQARRVDIYNAYIEALVRAGRAYPAFENAEELEAKRKAAVAAKQTYRYQRPSDVRAGVFPEDRWRRVLAGEAHVVRFLAPEGEVVVRDSVLGDVRIAPGELDDFVIRKADGFPTYHFAVVIDDELMGVTHVLRAQEHLYNTPRHVAMQGALRRLDNGHAFRTPVYAHMPLMFNPDGTKMSKRDKAKAARKAAKEAMTKDAGLTAAVLARRAGVDAPALEQFIAAESDALDVAEALARCFGLPLPEIYVYDFRRNGYIPSAIVNYIALLGWNPGMKTPDGKDLEKFDAAFIAKHFSVERIGRTNAKFDRAKLLSFNADAIGAMTDEEFASRWTAWLGENDPGAAAELARRGLWPENGRATPRLLALARALRPRAKTLRDAVRPASFALVGDDAYAFDPAAVSKHLGGAGLEIVRELRDAIAAQDDWSPGALNERIEAIAKARGMPNAGGVAQPARVALTGAGVSPGLGETLHILGRDSALARLDRCLKACAHGNTPR